jgi:polymorphic toxin system DSP-PTPase phosphatase-like protein
MLAQMISNPGNMFRQKMKTASLPIPNSYWVKPEHFLAGEYPGSHDLKAARQRVVNFLERGFTDFIDLTQSNELAPYDGLLKDEARQRGLTVTYARISIPDRDVPSLQTMTRILDSIDNSLNSGREVYVHCWGGVGRTGTTVGCYLVRHGRTGEQALAQIAEWWQDVPKRFIHPESPETQVQHEFILNWHEGVA